MPLESTNLLTLFMLHNFKFQVLFCKHPIVIYHCLPLFIIRLPQAETSSKTFFFFLQFTKSLFHKIQSKSRDFNLLFVNILQLKSYKRHE